MLELAIAQAKAQRIPALGLYVHVPFCAARCGYCDFNTYTAAELGGTLASDPPMVSARALICWAARLASFAQVFTRPQFAGRTWRSS